MTEWLMDVKLLRNTGGETRKDKIRNYILREEGGI
jgi:hypothetical protein